MFPQNHQQGGPHSSRLNGASNQRLPLLYNYPQVPPQHQSHTRHHHSMQPDHSGGHASNNGPILSHHANFATGVFPSSSPYNNTTIQNGHTVASRNNQAYTEHWREQLKRREECANADMTMKEGNPHFYARLMAPKNWGIGAPLPSSERAAGAADSEQDGRRIPWSVDTPNNRQDWHNMDLSGQGFRNIALQLSDYDFLQELYIASNKLSHLPASIGQLRQLRHLDASFNLIQELPPEIGMCTYLQTLLLFDNQLQDLPFEMGSLHLLEMLGIEGNPIEPHYKQEIMERGTQSLISKLRESGRVPPAPPLRQPVTIQEDVSPNLEKVKVFSWNILCDKYATSTHYGYTPTEALSWDYRKNCILDEIRERDADILCLQEVSQGAFDEFLKPELGRLGYQGSQRPKMRMWGMAKEQIALIDGCATFYKTSKFVCLDWSLVDFGGIGIKRSDMRQTNDVFDRVMPEANIGLICFLESIRTGARFVIGNLHLTWRPVLADVKLVQSGIMMEHITELAERYVLHPPKKDKHAATLSAQSSSAAGGEESQDTTANTPAPEPENIEPAPSQEYRVNTDVPLVVCGDFNSTINSSVYELMSTGRVAPDHLDLINRKYGAYTIEGIEHPFSLRDAYVHLKGTADGLPFTNYTPGFADVIDYIWYSANTLEVVALLGPPDAEYLKRVPAFPFHHFPSDHIQIMAEFVVKARKDRKLPEVEGSNDRKTS